MQKLNKQVFELIGIFSKPNSSLSYLIELSGETYFIRRFSGTTFKEIKYIGKDKQYVDIWIEQLKRRGYIEREELVG